MKSALAPTLFVLAMSVCLPVPAARPGNGSEDKSPPSNRPSLKCDTGPVHKTYGGTEWLVYSCADNRSVVIVSNKGNPAMPFIFVFAAKGDGYHLSGEGTGRKEATAAAFNELKRLTSEDIAQLVQQAKKLGKPM